MVFFSFLDFSFFFKEMRLELFSNKTLNKKILILKKSYVFIFTISSLKSVSKILIKDNDNDETEEICIKYHESNMNNLKYFKIFTQL